MEQTVPLSVAPVGVRLLLAPPRANNATAHNAADDATSNEPPGGRRLAQLGLRPGAEVIVVMRTSGGGRVVAVAGSRIALDRATAQRLHVIIPEQVGQAGATTARTSAVLAG